MRLIDWFGIAGGLALFLYGIKMMGDGIEKLAGSKLRDILEKLTKNRFCGLVVGIVITAIIQSSNATTAMAVNFVNAGMMDFSNAVGVIMGANIGTTVTGQLIAFKVETIAPIIAFIGVAGFILFKGKRTRNAFQTVAGLGILFMGMALMKENMSPLVNEGWFISLMGKMENPLLGILAGMIFTMIVQSASASVGILQAMAGAGVIGLGQAIFFICGTNIGSTIAAVTAAIGGSHDAKRTAAIHIMFNVLATVICVIACTLLPCLDWIETMSQGDPVQQIANANTLLKVCATVAFFPLSPLMEKLAHKIIRGEDKGGRQLLHIRKLDFGMTSVAIAQVQAEVDRMFSIAFENFEIARRAMFEKSKGDVEAMDENEDVINFLNKEITNALVEINSQGLGASDAALIDQMHHIIVDFERIGDHSYNLKGHIEHMREEKISFSEHAMQGIKDLMGMVSDIMRDAYISMKNQNEIPLSEIERKEQAIDDLVKELQDQHINRLEEHRCTADAGMIYIEILTDLERMGDHSMNVAEAAI